MTAILVVLSSFSGLLIGWLVWWAAGRFVVSYRLQTEEPGSLDAGALPPLAAMTVGAMALWGAYVGWQAASLAVAASALVVTAILLCIALVDFQVRRIPNPLVLTLLALAVVQIIWLGRPSLTMAALGLVVAGGFFFLVALITRSALGMGDVKLEAAIGALLGYAAVLAAIVAGVLAGGIAAAFLLITKRAGRKDPFAYGPYLALGAWIVLVQAWGLWPL